MVDKLTQQDKQTQQYQELYKKFPELSDEALQRAVEIRQNIKARNPQLTDEILDVDLEAWGE